LVIRIVARLKAELTQFSIYLFPRVWMPGLIHESNWNQVLYM
jgi:hypothetical protein